jgi:hypothetical protein
MKKYTDLIEMLEKIFGKGSFSRTIGTRTNVVRFPRGQIVDDLDTTKSEYNIEKAAEKKSMAYDVVKKDIEDRMGDITKMNDAELLNYTANVRRMMNVEFPPPLPEADIVKFGSGQEIKGKGLEQLIEKQGTKNPPTTVAGQLETQGKKLEKAGEDLKEITEPRSLVGDMLKDYADFDKYMQSSQRSGYVRATVRQIMREDIQAGKLKLPKELQDQVMQGIGEPIDIYRKVYGEGALEQIDSLADDLGQFRTEEEAAKFARSKYTFEPKVEPVDESMTYDELGNLIKKKSDEPEGKADGGRIGFNKGKRVKSQIDKLLEQLNKKTQGKKSMETVNPKTGEVTVPKKPIRRAEEPTGMTTMDPEPEIVDEKSIPKPKKKITQRYNQDIIKAADEIYPSYDDPKIAADQIVDSYAQMKYGLEDQYGLSNKERMDLYTQAYDYVMDYNRGALRKTAGESINISDPKTAEAFTNFARENDPEGFKKIQKIVDDINNKNALEEFDIKNREPNANGGIAGLL